MMQGLLGKEESLSRLEVALAGSPADATELVMLGESTSVTRYANSEIHQNVEQTGVRVAVRVTVGKATARVFTSSLDPQTCALQSSRQPHLHAYRHPIHAGRHFLRRAQATLYPTASRNAGSSPPLLYRLEHAPKR